MKKLKFLFFVIVAVFLVWLTWNIKPAKVVEREVVVPETLRLDEVLKDSLVRMKEHWYNKWFGLRQAYDVLLERWRAVKPETISIGDTAKFVLSWEYIVKVAKKGDICSVYTYRITSLVDKDSLEFLDTTGTDSVYGIPKKYTFKVGDEFVLTSKRDGLFGKTKKEFPLSLMLGLTASRTIWDDAGFGELDLKRFSLGVEARLWYKDDLELRTGLYTDRGWRADAFLNIWGIGNIRR